MMLTKQDITDLQSVTRNLLTDLETKRNRLIQEHQYLTRKLWILDHLILSIPYVGIAIALLILLAVGLIK